MKYIIIFIVILLFSCAFESPENNWYDIPDELMPKELDSNTDQWNVWHWVTENIEYKSYANGFVPAKKTLEIKAGNCANKALAKLALWYNLTGEKGKLGFCMHEKGLHYIAIYNNKYYELYIKEIYREIEFDDIAGYIYCFQGVK